MKNSAACRVGAGLEYGPHPVSAISVTESLQRVRDRGGMMTKIVNHLNATRFAAKLLPARDPGETLECAGDCRRGHIVKSRRRRRHCGVVNVEFADKRNFENVVAEFEP